MPTPRHYDRAAHRLPQRFRDCGPAPGGCGVGPCPIRPDSFICDGEGPHATSWLCVRGDTVRLLTPGLRWYTNRAYAGRGMGGMGLYGTKLASTMSGHLRGSEEGNRYSPSGREVLTRSGVMIDVTAPRPDQIRLGDIAVSLAAQVRFTGHCPLRPTVAQHSLAVEWIAGMLFQGIAHGGGLDPNESYLLAERDCRREALMHDAPEFLVSDLNGAVKKDIRPRDPFDKAPRAPARTESRFDELETLAEDAITARFDLTHDWGAIVHEADCLACAYEMAWGGWCQDAHPPRWVRDSIAVQAAYGWVGGVNYGYMDDGGESAFLARAEFLGLR